MTELLEAVDDLTLPRNVKVRTDDGHTWATEDALLLQLQQAVTSSLNSGSGAGGSPWTRNVLDAFALYKAAMIESAIGDWCRIEKIPATRDSIADLRAWYVARLTSGESSDFYLAQLRSWADQIREMVNPPKTIEITKPCPACGQGVFTNEMGEVVRNPLVLQYRPESGSIWQDAKATCRACKTVWEQEWRLRELSHAIDETHTA